MWIVKLVKPIPFLNNDYPDGYFPRKFHYKSDAVNLAGRVRTKGGIAAVEKDKGRKK